MRIGFNPHKDQKHQDHTYLHQVIVPVYIPNLEGYFKDSLSILKYTLESLFKTSHKKTYFTIANNGSCQEVVGYLNELHKKGSIQEVIHTTDTGKLNAILKSISGHNFKFITVTDADVLFLNDWQQETYRVFDAFPKAGAVCPTPSSKSFKTHTANVWFDLFFSKRLRFTSVKNPEALKMFASSIGNPEFYNQYHLNQYLTVENNKVRAVVGAGHFVTTYKAGIFNKLETKYSDYKLGGTSEKEILDIPVVKNDLWRLSTEDNFAYHMGNVEEPWMKEKLNEIIGQGVPAFPTVEDVTLSKASYWIKTKLFGKLILRKKAIFLFLRYKGLSKEAAKKYN